MPSTCSSSSGMAQFNRKVSSDPVNPTVPFDAQLQPPPRPMASAEGAVDSVQPEEPTTAFPCASREGYTQGCQKSDLPLCRKVENIENQEEKQMKKKIQTSKGQSSAPPCLPEPSLVYLRCGSTPFSATLASLVIMTIACKWNELQPFVLLVFK